MYVIQKTDVADVLRRYGIKGTVTDLSLEAYYTSGKSVCMVIKIICESSEYILKLIRDSLIDSQLENKQAAFSEILRKEGLRVPKKYRTIITPEYTLEIYIQNILFYAQLEQYYGEDVLQINKDLVGFLGDFLGESHRISLERHIEIGNGSTCSAINEGRVTFDKVMNKDLEENLNPNLVLKTKEKHDKTFGDLRYIFSKLPKTAVHGDLGLVSNIVQSKSGYGVIDFNLAGDESLLVDVLITWYSSRYSMLMAGRMSENEIECYRDIFLKSYNKKRDFTIIEKENLEIISCFLNGVYYLKFLGELFCRGYKTAAINFADEMEKNYEKMDSEIDMRV